MMRIGMRAAWRPRRMGIPWRRQYGGVLACPVSSRACSDDMKTRGVLQQHVVRPMNAAIRKHPGETMAVLFAGDMCGIAAAYGVISAAGIHVSPEFALAFAASRPFRRLRLPLDLMAAAVVAKVCPAFSQVKLSELRKIMQRKTQPALHVKPAKESDPNASSLVTKSMDKMFQVIDKYGAAYMIGSRLMGVSIVSVLYVLIQQGVDLTSLLATVGFQGMGSTLGVYAAAVVFSSAFYPVTLGITGHVVPIVARARKMMVASILQR